MAIYDTDADSATAITAWLAQYKVAASGAITFVTGTHTFHVKWINRSLQKLAWDFAISGDDEVNLVFPNPSKEEALGKIVTLNDWTTDYTINYTVTDTVMQQHFGGSVSQNGGADIYYGLIVLGSTYIPLPLKILQNNVELTSHWGNGKNQTDSNTLLRVMIKGRTGGADTDNLLVHVKASTWLETYAVWGTTLALGEAVASITTADDPQNTTLQATVEAYGITKSEGYNLLDLDGNGNKPYLGEWSYAGAGAGTKKSLYEFVKAILVDGTTNTLYGVDGDLWTGRLYDCVIGVTRTGTWVQNETLTWGTGATAGTGHLVGVDTLTGTATVRLVLHLDTGVFPADTLVITGNGLATGTVSGTPALLTTSPNHLAQYTGAWIGAYGIGFASGEIGSVDSFKDLDGNIVTPPNNVTITGTIEALNAADDLHLFLAPKHATLNAPDKAVYSCTGEIVTAGVIRVDAIAADTPQTGWFGVLKTGTTTYKFYEYTSWTGTTFTLAGTIADDAITAADPGFHAIAYDSMTGGGTTKSFSNSLVYSADISVIGWVRHGDASGVDKIVSIAGTIGSGGFSFSGTMEAEV